MALRRNLAARSHDPDTGKIGPDSSIAGPLWRVGEHFDAQARRLLGQVAWQPACLATEGPRPRPSPRNLERCAGDAGRSGSAARIRMSATVWPNRVTVPKFSGSRKRLRRTRSKGNSGKCRQVFETNANASPKNNLSTRARRWGLNQPSLETSAE